MIEPLLLRDALRIETVRGPDGVRTRIYSGDRPIEATPPLLDAALRVAGGQPLSPEQRALLRDAGILRPANPFGGPPPDVLALRPDIAVWLDLIAPVVRPAGDPVRVTPGASLPATLFIPPYRLAPLLDLHRVALEAWRRLSRRGDRDPHETLTRVVRGRLTEDFALQAVVEDRGVDGEVHLVPLVRLDEDTPQYPLRGLLLRRDRIAGAEGTLIPASWETLAAASAPVGALAAGVHGQDLRARFGDGVRGTVLELLGEAMLGEPHPLRLTDHLDGEAIVHLGHGSLLCRVGGATILVDPWLPPASRADAVLPPPCTILGPIDAVCFTRLDLDTAPLDTLVRLDREVRVVIARHDDASPSHMPTLLRLLGFERVEQVATGETVRVGAAELTALPFRDVAPRGLPMPAASWVVRGPSGAALILGTGGPVDVDDTVSPVFTCRHEDDRVALERGWHTLLTPSRTWLDASGARAADRIARLPPTHAVVVYAEGGAPWYPDAPFVRRATAAERALEPFWPPVEALAAQSPAPVHVSRPYDVYRLGGGWVANLAHLMTRR